MSGHPSINFLDRPVLPPKKVMDEYAVIQDLYFSGG